MQVSKKILILIFCVFTTVNIHARTKDEKTVIILTWWGYLDDPSISILIKNKCGATLSSDTYTSNDDMLRRFRTNAKRYDILVFSDTTYNEIKKYIFLNKSNLWKNSNKYNPLIKSKYLNSHFPHNIAYFQHSLTGFIWNSNNIILNEDDTISSIFKKAKHNKIILMDDPREVNLLLTEANDHVLNNLNNEISLVHFKKLSQDTQVYISNEFNKIYNQKEFAFSFQWSGESFSKDLDNKNYHFLINKHLSYVATDMIAQLKDSKFAACAANALASKEFLSALQKESHYFSPYGNIDNIPESSYKELYKEFLKDLSKLHWLEPPSSAQLKKLNQEWEKVKFELEQERNEY
jgi:hypothetical protein